VTVPFFVDVNVVLYGAAASPATDACLEILEAIGRGEADGRMSTAALEEVWHIERSGRAGDLGGLTERTYTLFTPLLSVTDEAFRFALRLDAPRLGSNDRLHVGTCMTHQIEVVVSADAGFDAVPGIRRVEPLNARARRRLLSSGR
jgi:uncharacterized protein